MTTATQPSTGLRVERATVRFGPKTAVDDVSLDLPKGRVLAVLGPSGCGKSTLLRAIAGLEQLTSGRISYAGRDLAGVPPHRRGFAMMFQDGQLFAHRDVAGNVGYPLGLRGIRGAARAQRVGELLDLVGLPGYEKRAVTTLSGGEQQRVTLARALAVDPALLLLDEPLSALDRSLRERLAADLRAILTSSGTTALLVTHDHDEAFTVADDMAVMDAGRVVQSGTTSGVWRAPATADIARFLGYAVVLPPEVAPRVVPGATGAVALRRSALRVVAGGEGTEGSALSGTVTAVAAASDALRVEVDVPGVGSLPTVAALGADVAPGQRVELALSPVEVARLPEA